MASAGVIIIVGIIVEHAARPTSSKTISKQLNKSSSELYSSKVSYWDHDTADMAAILDGCVETHKPNINDSREHLE